MTLGQLWPMCYFHLLPKATPLRRAADLDEFARTFDPKNIWKKGYLRLVLLLRISTKHGHFASSLDIGAGFWGGQEKDAFLAEVSLKFSLGKP